MNNHAIADDASVVNTRIGVEDAIATNLRTRADVNARINDSSRADAGGRFDMRFAMNALMRVFAIAVQQHHRAAVGILRVLGAQQGNMPALHVFPHDHR